MEKKRGQVCKCLPGRDLAMYSKFYTKKLKIRIELHLYLFFKLKLIYISNKV